MIIDDIVTSFSILNVHYSLERDSNLIFLKILKAKNFEFRNLNDQLSVIDNEKNVILQARRQNNVYLLN